MISLLDHATSVTVKVGEKVTIRIEESAVDGLLWSAPQILGNGVSLDASRSLTIEDSNVEYREFVFRTHQSGQNLVSTSLRQAGLEEGIKNFSMVVNVREARESVAVVS